MEEWRVAPVPANDRVTITRTKPDNAPATYNEQELFTIQITDMFGNVKKEIRNVQVKPSYQINVSALPVGNYIIHFISKNNTTAKQIKIER